MLAQYIPKSWAVVIILASMLAFAFVFAFATDSGTSYVQAPGETLAVFDQDLGSLTATGSSIETTYDASIAIASTAVTDFAGIIESGATYATADGILFLLATIGVIYVVTGFGRHRLRRIGTPQTRRTPTRPSTGSHGGEAYAALTAVLAVVLIGALVYTAETLLA